MIIKTTIEYSDEEERDLMGKSEHSDEILLDLNEVSGLMPGNEDCTKTIVFLQGRDLMIVKSYKEVKSLWLATKNRQGTLVNIT
jgi:hypothetical protein